MACNVGKPVTRIQQLLFYFITINSKLSEKTAQLLLPFADTCLEIVRSQFPYYYYYYDYYYYYYYYYYY